MKLEFDPAKDRANIQKHGISLETAAFFDFETASIAVDNRHDYSETRYGATGFIGDRIYVLTFVKRDFSYRPISLRKANFRERKRYVSQKTS